MSEELAGEGERRPGAEAGSRLAENARSDEGRRSNQIVPDRLQWGRLADWAELVRLPNVFTLLSDSMAAAIIVGSFYFPISAFVLVLLASLCAYWAGMILNDIVDLEEDRRFRPDRPLASDRISPVVAGHVATGMLLIGPILVLAAMTLHEAVPLWMGAAFLSSVLLSLAVRSYDSALKETPVGPLLMGSCRFLNICMVGFAMLAVSPEKVFPQELIYFALGIGLYILGVTVFARMEDRESSQGMLTFGLALEVVGLVIISRLPYWAEPRAVWPLNPNQGYPLLVALIGLTVVRRGFTAISNPSSRKVQLAVKHAILTLVLIDAAVVLMWAGPWYALAVVLLLLPALFSAIRFRST